MAKKQEPKAPSAPLTVRQAIQSPSNLVKKGAKGIGKLGVDVGAGMAAEQLLQTAFPGLTDWAQRANINIGPVNVSAYDPIGAFAFETGMQASQALRGAKVTPGGLAAGAGGYLVGSKIGQGLARSLGAEEGGFAEMGAEMAGGLAGQMGVDRLLGGGAQAAQAAKASQAAQVTKAAQTAKTVGQRAKDIGKGFSAAFRAGTRPTNLTAFNPAAAALEKGIAGQAQYAKDLGSVTLGKSKEIGKAFKTLEAGKKLSPFAKAGGVAGRLSGGLGLLGTGLSEYEKGTQYQGLGAEASNVALTTGLGVATPAALAGLGTLATGGGAASAGVAAGAAAAAALPLAVAAGGLAAGAGLGRAAMTDIEKAESAQTTLRTYKDVYKNTKSQMTPQQRKEMEAQISQLEKTAQEQQPSTLSRAYQETYGKLAGVKSQEELKKAVSAASEEGMKDVTFTRDASGKVTGVKSDVADEMRRRSEEKARETAGMSAREKDEAQAARVAFMKSQAEKNIQYRQPEIKKVEAEEEKARVQSARDAVAQAIAAGYEPDPELLKQAGVAGSKQPEAQQPKQVSKREAFQQKIDAEKKLSFDEWRKRFG